MKFGTYLALIGAAAAHQGHHEGNFLEHMKHKLAKKWHKAEKMAHKWGKKMHHGAEQASEDFHKDPKHFFGKIMDVITGHHEKKTQDFGAVQGHMEEFGFKGINIGALLACIGEEDKAALVADAAVQSLEQAYKDKSVEEAVGGVIALYAAYQSAVQGIPACKAIPTTAFEKKLAEPMTEEKKKEVAEVMQGFM